MLGQAPSSLFEAINSEQGGWRKEVKGQVSRDAELRRQGEQGLFINSGGTRYGRFGSILL
ncbi:MAG: hypothetical protein CSA33_01345 [Desulfobulbus propionicus]|nr:MAG: hypothetical protein CSA33_01345 [Desulfobulbus propionicus]